MNRKTKQLCALTVLISLVVTYLTVVSVVPDEVIAQWSLHKWVAAGLFVVLQGLNTWKAFLQNPVTLPPTPPVHDLGRAPAPPAHDGIISL